MSSDRTRVMYMIDGLGHGGAERQLYVFLKHLNRERYEPRVCVLSVKQGNVVADQIRALGIEVDLFEAGRLLDPRGNRRLQQYLLSHRPAILHSHLDYAAMLGGGACRAIGVPHVTTLHTMEAPAWHTRAYWRQRMLYRALRQSCDRVITVSGSVRSHHLRRSGLSANKVVTIHNGIELDRFTAPTQEQREALWASFGVPQDAPLIVAVAVLRAAKGVQHLIDAAPAILRSQSEARVLIVGTGSYESSLRERVTALGIGDRVIFAGHREDVPVVLSAGDVFVLPTLRDALPTVVIEAMAAGTPVVASGIDGLLEMVEDGVTGLLVPPADARQLADACLRLLNQPLLSASIIQAARAAAQERFGIDVHVNRVVGVYEEVISETAEGHRP